MQIQAYVRLSVVLTSCLDVHLTGAKAGDPRWARALGEDRWRQTERLVNLGVMDVFVYRYLLTRQTDATVALRV